MYAENILGWIIFFKEYYKRGVNMRCESVLILFAAFMAFSCGLVAAQENQSAVSTAVDANVTTAANATEAVAPQEAVSRYTQLSNATPAKNQVLGKELTKEYSDVTKTADTAVVFTREAGATTPSVKVAVTDVSPEGKWVEVTNQAVGSWDMLGWALASAGNTTFMFPEFTLEMGQKVKIHEGNGAGSETDLYTNSTASLWNDNEVSLLDADGRAISKILVPTAPAQTGYVDPLAKRIQY